MIATNIRPIAGIPPRQTTNIYAERKMPRLTKEKRNQPLPTLSTRRSDKEALTSSSLHSKNKRAPATNDELDSHSWRSRVWSTRNVRKDSKEANKNELSKSWHPGSSSRMLSKRVDSGARNLDESLPWHAKALGNKAKGTNACLGSESSHSRTSHGDYHAESSKTSISANPAVVAYKKKLLSKEKRIRTICEIYDILDLLAQKKEQLNRTGTSPDDHQSTAAKFCSQYRQVIDAIKDLEDIIPMIKKGAELALSEKMAKYEKMAMHVSFPVETIQSK